MDLMVLAYGLIIYFLGLAFYTRRSLIALRGFRAIKARQNVDVIANHPTLKRYIFLKPLLWPYYFLTEKSPLVRLSEVFFSRYGDKGYTYFGTKGLQHFCNDVFKGKNRYKHYASGKIISPLLHEESDQAAILFAKKEDTFLLTIIRSNPQRLADITLTRFVLDDCERLTASEFRNRIYQAGLGNPMHIMQQIQLNVASSTQSPPNN